MLKQFYRYPLAEDILDSMFWLHNKNDEYSMRSGSNVARQLAKEEDWAESFNGVFRGNVWKTLWKLKIPNKVKVYGWKACCNILFTRANLAQKQINKDNYCEVCKNHPETKIHAL